MPVPQEQEATVALLRSLAGRPPIETHISLVFVGTDTVWKLRKAVRLPFLDFTPLAERHRTAQRELELNAPAAPGLYRDIVPVTQTPGHPPELSGTGPVTDWVLRMAPVPADDFLDTIARRGDLTEALQDALGDAVAAYHAALPAVPLDHVAATRAIALGLIPSARAAGLPETDIETWRVAATRHLDALAPWLRARADQGFVCRGHGDLHLGNLCLWQGRPVPFDALEFDESLATLDVAYDLAFLLMDLQHRIGREAANRVLNRYLARTGDHDLPAGLPLFLSMRAMVRAHVEAKEGHDAEGRTYLAMALDYLHPAPPVVLAIGGLPGTGKSTLARALAPDLGAAPGAVILRSDEIRKHLHGVAPETTLSESAYSRDASRDVFTEMFAGVTRIAGHGHAVIADATFLDPPYRAAVARAAGVTPFLGIWLQAPLDLLRARIAARRNDASDATVALLHRLAPRDPGPGDWLAVDATDRDTALARIRDRLRALTRT